MRVKAALVCGEEKKVSSKCLLENNLFFILFIPSSFFYYKKINDYHAFVFDISSTEFFATQLTILGPKLFD